MKKLAMVFGVMMFSGLAMAQQDAQPSWTFGCKLDAQKAEKVAQTQPIQEVKSDERNTWSFDETQTTVVSMK
jgi:hypothetical protein